jgi:6-phosphogluconolactonase
MPASDGPHDGVQEAAAAYGDLVRSGGTGQFDVVMLGVGPDGHVASLFPGSEQLDADDAIAVAVTDSPKPPPERVTLTLGALNHSSEVWFVVAGAGKAEAVAKALATGDDAADLHDVPAVGVHGRDATVWFLDEEAASRL